ncbi:MAG: M15 family metallopeptidase [Myxococcales bacterium]|nr:M15 family metallopeptidase [Myxococcales bacterium]
MRPHYQPFLASLVAATAALAGCDSDDLTAERGLAVDAAPELGLDVAEHAHEPEPDGPEYYTLGDPDVLPAINCDESKDTGYVKGDPFEITVVTVDGKPVEVETANAYYAMQQAAAADGVGIKIVSGFRTMKEQQYLYNCYINCNCNNCNLAAKPGYSNHQSGHALDLNTGASGVLKWLEAHGGEWGFKRTVPSENWHYEWWGGGPPQDGPCGTPLWAGEPTGQSFPALDDPPILLEVGETHTGWFELRNDGAATWGQATMLATSPEEPSGLVDDSWPAPTRAARLDETTKSGKVGRFSLTIRGNTPGEFIQKFSVVHEDEDAQAWFAEDAFALRVLVVEPAPPATTGDSDGTDSDADASTSGGDADSDTDGATGDTSGAPTTTGGEQDGGEEDTSSTSAASGADDPGFDDLDRGDEGGCGCVTGRSGGAGGTAGAALGLLLLGLGRRRRY